MRRSMGRVEIRKRNSTRNNHMKVVDSNAKVTFMEIQIFFMESGQMAFARLTSILKSQI